MTDMASRAMEDRVEQEEAARAERLRVEAAAERERRHVGRSEPSEAGRRFFSRPEREFRALREEQFLEPMNRLSEKVEPFSNPEELVQRINPDYETGEPYQANCADCARCFERSWRGSVEEAAGRAYEVNARHDPDLPGLYVEGEPSAMTEEWAGREMRPIRDPLDLEEQLREAGPGSSAVVHTHWEDAHGHAHGHAYNVVNDRGHIRVVDAQTREVLPFDRESIRPGISPISIHRGLVWDAHGALA